ncbi:MAG: hypothetical protein HY343_03465 [Lentisphaerae bacterium]|nr:hypothetical protein [Lentisphaerota bacterium]
MIRFEILLPLYYNDGRPIEAERFAETDDELLEDFGATTRETVAVRGRWKYQSTVYEDRLIRVRVDVADEPENWEFMRSFKEKLKVRFDQIDIYLTAQRIEVI